MLSRHAAGRLWTLLSLLALVAVLPASVVAQAGGAGGNAADAQSCQKAGFTDWVREDGTGFGNTGDCASYTARGGELFPRRLAFCLAEWSSWARSTDIAIGFTSKDECLAYDAAGGTIVPKAQGFASLGVSKLYYPSPDPQNPAAGSCNIAVAVTVSGYNWVDILATGRLESYSGLQPVINNQIVFPALIVPWSMSASGTTVSVQGVYVGPDGVKVFGEYLLYEALPDTCP